MNNGTVTMVKLKEGPSVYTRTVGRGVPILLLHGGPGADHRAFTIFEKHVDLEKYSLVFYDQLGSKNSDKIPDESFLSMARYVDEVEQVRAALSLDEFVLLGHSWGGMLCMDYALKYEKDRHLKGVVISNMVDSTACYLNYLDKLRREALTEEEYAYMAEAEHLHQEENIKYQALVEKLNSLYMCRLNPAPEFLQDPNVPVKEVYHHFQGDNEFVVTGAMLGWDRSGDIVNIQTRTLCTCGLYDTMDPGRVEEMGRIMPNGQSYVSPEGSHCSFWDDSAHYFQALDQFLSSL